MYILSSSPYRYLLFLLVNTHMYSLENNRHLYQSFTEYRCLLFLLVNTHMYSPGNNIVLQNIDVYYFY